MTNQILVGLVQVNAGFADAYYFPYSVGLMQAYTLKYAADLSRFSFLAPIFARKQPEAVARKLLSANVVAFSVSVWNEQISLAIAREIKRKRPDTVIIFGGPQVPDRSHDFMLAHPAVDIAVHGEGEMTFLQILESLEDGRIDPEALTKIPSVTFRRGMEIVQTPIAHLRIQDLDAIPSPYLTGVFDQLLGQHPNLEWLGLWETNRGCPFSCAYCDWGRSQVRKIKTFSMDRIAAEMQWFADHQVQFIFCCDGNFGLLPRDLDIVEMVIATRKRSGYPHALSVQNTKNATERSYRVHQRLTEASLNKGVTLAMQSMDETALRSVGRQNVSVESFAELQRRFNRDGVPTYTDLILALPEETLQTFIDGTARIMDMGQHNRIQFINLSILPNAVMGDPDYQARFGMEVVRTRIINLHGSLDSRADEIEEYQHLVVATQSMPREDWVAARVFSWMTSLIHYDKLLQIPIVLLREETGMGYDAILKAFLAPDAAQQPVLAGIRCFFETEAQRLQAGGAEYKPAPEWLNIFWPHDEYIFIQLATGEQLKAFYAESRQLLTDILIRRGYGVPDWLDEAIHLNQMLLRLPEPVFSRRIELRYDIWGAYQRVLRGAPAALRPLPHTCMVDHSERWATLEDWLREVVWYGNKRGAYLAEPLN